MGAMDSITFIKMIIGEIEQKIIYSGQIESYEKFLTTFEITFRAVFLIASNLCMLVLDKNVYHDGAAYHITDRLLEMYM